MSNSYVYEEENNLLPEGEYEAYIEKIVPRITPSGKHYISLQYRLRDDVEQVGKNRCVFESIWEEKENPTFINRKRINRLLGTQNVKEGETFENIDGVIEFLTGAYLKLHVAIVRNEYKDKDENIVMWYRSTDYPPKSINDKEELKEVNEEIPF